MRLVMRDVEDSEITGGRVTGPLHLFRDPLLDLEGATKRYVDAIPNNLSASLITGGTLRNNMLPAWGGEVTTAAGNRVISIKSTVAANTYQSVNVNIKGLVVGGGPLVVSDIPNLNWSKISKGRPTSLAGYGITDGINLNGGSLTGSLVLSRNPVLNNEVATKNYSDEIGILTSLNTGDIIRKLTPVTPTGFLKCNGGIVNKNMYSDLYNVIKETYTTAEIIGPSKPWKQQNGFASGNLGTVWREEPSFPATLNHSQAIVTKNRVYMLGGSNGSAYTNIVYTAVIKPDGEIGTWELGTPLPGALAFSNLAVTKNRVYLLGGDGSAIVYTAIINSDGTLGPWVTAPPLPGAVPLGETFITKNRIYLLGAGSNIVYTATITEDGTIGHWYTANPLPQYTWRSQIVVTKTKVYIVGGSTGTWTSSIDKVFVAPIEKDGTLGAWSETTPLPMGIGNSQIYTNKTHAYIISGYNTKNVYWAPILPDDSLGEWTVHSELPVGILVAQIFATSSRLYLTEGYQNRKIHSTTLTGGKNDYSEYYDRLIQVTYEGGKFDRISVPGSGKPWKHQYLFNDFELPRHVDWTLEPSPPRTFTHGQLVATKNRVYLLGLNANLVYTAIIDSEGNLGPWVTTTSTPVALAYTQAIITKNKVVTIGGSTNRVFYSNINEDGTLGVWSDGPVLPLPIGYSQAVIIKDRVYLIGGYYSGGFVNTVYYATILEDGSLSNWILDHNLLPTAFSESQAIVTKNRVYMLGGDDGTGGYVPKSTVYYSNFSEDGSLGPWTRDIDLPEKMGYSQAITTNNRVYLLGGLTHHPRTYSAKILEDGSLGKWEEWFDIAAIKMGGWSLITSTKLYLGGGSNGLVHSTPFIGGVDDYSKFYDGTYKPLDKLDSFNLPSMNNLGNSPYTYYIKY